jgi:hypothetical protein
VDAAPNHHRPATENLWLSTLPFIAAALIVGVWRETRIFGELSAIAAVTFALQLEQVVPYNSVYTSRKS